MSNEPEETVSGEAAGEAEELPWEQRMLAWAKSKVAEEESGRGTAAAPTGLAEGQPEDAAEPLDFARAKARFDQTTLHEALKLTLEELRPGFARIRLTIDRVNLGGVNNSAHGGIQSLMADIVALQAMGPLLRKGEYGAGTVDLNITYLRPATGIAVDAVGTILRKGRTTVVTDVEIRDLSGLLCAKARTTYAIRRSGEG